MSDVCILPLPLYVTIYSDTFCLFHPRRYIFVAPIVHCRGFWSFVAASNRHGSIAKTTDRFDKNSKLTCIVWLVAAAQLNTVGDDVYGGKQYPSIT